MTGETNYAYDDLLIVSVTPDLRLLLQRAGNVYQEVNGMPTSNNKHRTDFYY